LNHSMIWFSDIDQSLMTIEWKSAVEKGQSFLFQMCQINLMIITNYQI
jgi:hypothetical protein